MSKHLHCFGCSAGLLVVGWICLKVSMFLTPQIWPLCCAVRVTTSGLALSWYMSTSFRKRYYYFLLNYFVMCLFFFFLFFSCTVENTFLSSYYISLSTLSLSLSLSLSLFFFFSLSLSLPSSIPPSLLSFVFAQPLDNAVILTTSYFPRDILPEWLSVLFFTFSWTVILFKKMFEACKSLHNENYLNISFCGGLLEVILPVAVHLASA